MGQLLRVALLLSLAVALAAAGSPRTRSDDRRGGGPPAPPPDAGAEHADGGAARDPDQGVIDHLDELEQLELLQHLGLVDESGEDDAPKPRVAPPP